MKPLHEIELPLFAWVAIDYPTKKHKHPNFIKQYEPFPEWQQAAKTLERKKTYRFFISGKYEKDNVLTYNNGDDTYYYCKFDSMESIHGFIELVKLADSANEVDRLMDSTGFVWEWDLQL